MVSLVKGAQTAGRNPKLAEGKDVVLIDQPLRVQRTTPSYVHRRHIIQPRAERGKGTFYSRSGDISKNNTAIILPASEFVICSFVVPERRAVFTRTRRTVTILVASESATAGV